MPARPEPSRADDLVALLLPQVRRFARELDPAAIDRSGGVTAEIRSAAGELGLFGLSVPEAYGGAGLALGQVARLVACVAEADRSVATTLGLHCGLGTQALIRHGTDTLRRRWLPRVATGEAIASFAATEPGAGSDLTSIRTTCEPDGDGIRLDGEKCYVTNGGFASLYTVLARSPSLGGRHAQTLVCVPRETAGVTVGPEEHKLGLKGSSTVTVRFDGVRLSREHILGEPGRAAAYAYEALTWGRSLLSAGCVGTARAALATALTHIQTRRQSGRALAEFGATRAHVAAMAARVYGMNALVEHVGALEAAGAPIEAASSIAKVVSSEGAFDVCDRAIQLLGGIGYLEDAGVARMLRDCRVTRIFEGANDVLLVRLGTGIVAQLPELRARRVHGPHEGGGDPALLARWDALDHELSAAVAAVRARHGVRATSHQRLLQHLARTHIALHTSSLALHAAPHEDAALRALATHAARIELAAAEASLRDATGAEALEDHERLVSESLYDPSPTEIPVVPTRPTPIEAQS